jgi:hypothetical protein
MVKSWGGSASWHLQWSLAESLQIIMDWHKAYLAKQNMNGEFINQIKEFMEGLKPCKQ